MFYVLFSLALAAETCGEPFASSVTVELDQSWLVLDRGVLTIDSRVIGVEVVQMSEVAANRVAFVQRRPDSMLLDLLVWDAEQGVRVLVDGSRPSQPVLSPDGAYVGFVDARTSIASVYTVPFEGGEPAQRTNVGLVRTPGRAPEGFVSPPRSGFEVDGRGLTWTEDGVTHVVSWNGGDL
ncbi:MAG: hypothetical protein R3F61_25960 [Myxococcota bacterium]